MPKYSEAYAADTTYTVSDEDLIAFAIDMGGGTYRSASFPVTILREYINDAAQRDLPVQILGTSEYSKAFFDNSNNIRLKDTDLISLTSGGASLSVPLLALKTWVASTGFWVTETPLLPAKRVLRSRSLLHFKCDEGTGKTISDSALYNGGAPQLTFTDPNGVINWPLFQNNLESIGNYAGFAGLVNVDQLPTPDRGTLIFYSLCQYNTLSDGQSDKANCTFYDGKLDGLVVLPEAHGPNHGDPNTSGVVLTTDFGELTPLNSYQATPETFYEYGIFAHATVAKVMRPGGSWHVYAGPGSQYNQSRTFTNNFSNLIRPPILSTEHNYAFTNVNLYLTGIEWVEDTYVVEDSDVNAMIQWYWEQGQAGNKEVYPGFYHY